MRAVFIIYHRLNIENTKEIYQITKEFYQYTKEIHQITNEFHQLTNEFYLTNEQYLITNESYYSTNDGPTHMMTATRISGAILSAQHECGFLPPSGPMADPMAMPNPFGEQNRARAVGTRAQTSFVNVPSVGGALGQPSAYLQ